MSILEAFRRLKLSGRRIRIRYFIGELPGPMKLKREELRAWIQQKLGNGAIEEIDSVFLEVDERWTTYSFPRPPSR